MHLFNMPMFSKGNRNKRKTRYAKHDINFFAIASLSILSCEHTKKGKGMHIETIQARSGTPISYYFFHLHLCVQPQILS